ncbi:MAG: 50S ribosomal protein L2 [candidate division WOR-3 bacterium]|nr:50S ribosomal protein L2 [candidate division WOR-3 bacterium]
MAIKKHKAMTPGQRFRKSVKHDNISKDKPEKSLTRRLKKSGGRNNQGRYTAKRKGGGSKRRYRIIDFKRDKTGIPGKVKSIEYDPNRSALIALISYVDGEKRYILAPNNITVGSEIMAGSESPAKPGNALPLKKIPLGVDIHNVELTGGKGGQMIRSAGSAAQIIAREGNFCHIKMPSGEVRLVHKENYATIGRVSNTENMGKVLGKAGRKRNMGIKPRVRGVAKNPVDHPMGGGEGRSSGGRHPCNKNGLPAKGYKTRKKNKYSDKYIVSKRK